MRRDEVLGRLVGPLVGLGCVGALVLACFGSALLAGEQFGFRDAAHFYYPLYQRVQQEWEAGRLPLWSAEENAGMPLLGNPTAAVLYPGKLIYAALPYPWAARVYTVAHVLLALGAMVALMRHWGVSWTGSLIAGLGYAFGAPVLFQYCNIIYLVGAAWTPLALRAADLWLRLGRRRGLAELAVTLALPTLGGDPQAAYVIGLCAAGYAAGLAWLRGSDPARPRRRRWALLAGGLLALAAWIALVLAAAAAAPKLQPDSGPVARAIEALMTYRTWRYVPLGFWAVVALVILARWRHESRSGLRRGLVGLVGAAALATALMGMQLLPTLEFARLTARAAQQGAHEIFPFSLSPWRLLELAWPQVLGSSLDSRSWTPMIPPIRNQQFWVPSLYLGGLTLVLALGAFGLRNGPPGRAWLSLIALAGLALSLGEYGSPLLWARQLPGAEETLGTPDPSDFGETRRDGYLADGAGSPYWACATFLPGFRSFRYPSKFLSFLSLGLAGLAGFGWDRVCAGWSRRAVRVALTLAALGLAAWMVLEVAREPILSAGRVVATQNRGTFGPFDPVGALAETRHALLAGSLAMGLAALLIAPARGWPRLAGALALVALTVDLALANAALVITVPQSFFEEPPLALRIIEQAEAEDGSRAPYRIHRMPIWEPQGWLETNSPNRIIELFTWERRTIQPKYAIPYGAQYTLTQGVSELYDYWFFFGPFMANHDDAFGARFGLGPGQRLIYYPRRGFDLWNTKYFLLPRVPGQVEHRGIAAFLPHTERIYPPVDEIGPPGSDERTRQWDQNEDWQIRRNLNTYPRAWIVHQIRPVQPITSMSRADRQPVMEEIIYQADELWQNPTRIVHDPRQLAWVESFDPSEIDPVPSGAPPSPTETVTVTPRSPVRVELTAHLETPGIVVLADVYYPGWKLTLDGQPRPILRVNRMMRGAAVPSGDHQLVYTYEPESVRYGAVLSALGLLALGGLALWARRQSPPPDVPQTETLPGDPV